MTVLAELNSLWGSGSPPDLQSVMAIAVTAAEPLELLELLRVDQQRRWQAGAGLSVDEYLLECRRLPLRMDWALELLAGEMLSRSGLQPMTAAELRDRFPAYVELPEYLPSVVTETDSDVIESVCEHFERLCATDGRVPKLEYMLAGVAPRLRRDVFPRLLSIDLRWQQRRGATVVPQTWLQRFPWYGAAVQEVFGVVAGAVAGETAEHLSEQTVVPTDGSGMATADRGGAAVYGAGAGTAAIGRLGDYELLSELGRGGMGVVYRARQVSLNRLVALKTVLGVSGAGSQEVLRFRNEAESAANLRHPGIVGVYEVGEAGGRHYYSMEYIEGQDLSCLIRRNSLSGERAAAYLRQLAEAVEYAHEHGVLHRDLKPQNVLVDAEGRLRITDFGLAKRVQADSQLTGDFSVMGTPSYMPPEQAQAGRGPAGPWSDIYSLGAVLYELLTARPPFRADNPLETMRQLLEDDPIAPRLLNPRIALDLETICLKCLEKDPARRYASARLLSDELGRFLEGRPILARPLGRVQRVWRLCRRHPRESILSLLVFSAIVVGGLGVGWQWLRAESNLQRATRNFELLDRAADEMLVVVEEWVTRTPPRTEAQQQRLSSSLRLFEAFLNEEPANRAARRRLAETHARVAEIRRLLRQLDRAAHHFREAVRIFHELNELEAEPDLQLALARSLDDLGNVEREAGHFESAGAAFEETLKILRAEVNPSDTARMQAELSRALYNRGLLRFEQNQAAAAEADFVESIAASERALAVEPGSLEYRQGLARCRINLGVLLRNVGRSRDCLQQYTDAIQQLRELVQQQPSESEFGVELSQALLNLGNLLLSARTETPPLVPDSLAEAAGAFESAVQLLEQLTSEYPNVPLYHIQLASALNGVGGVQQEREELAAAEQSWQRAKVSFERVLSLSGESADVRSRLGLTLSNLALLVPKEQSERKLPLLQEACEQQRMALRMTPDAAPIRGYLRSHLLSLAKACLLVGRFSQAVTAALELEQLAVQRGDGRLAADLLVRSAVGIGADESLSAEEREARSVEWQGRAVEMLGRAIVAGVLKREDLRLDERFAALRAHPQFRELLDSDGPR